MNMWSRMPLLKDLIPIKGHLELCETHQLIDFKSASKISGSAFPLYTKVGAQYERGLINFMLDTHINNSYMYRERSKKCLNK